jgi:2-polyprenyl-3-methyl-5-hydroxy-6-metoxy-1,4-benzoquinol methylase
MTTLYGLDVHTQWEQICELHVLNLAKEHHPEWYRWRLTNNYERAVFLNGDYVYPRESARYVWANENLTGKSVMEVGCSTGYGIQFLDSIDTYVGIDYDPIIIEVAKEQEWTSNAIFLNKDINLLNEFTQYDTIIAFEVIEHLDNGLEIVDKLKQSCKNLLISVPHNEPVGFWGEHHKLHGLNESNFPGFIFDYIDEHGNISENPAPISEANRCNLMLCRWIHG